MNKTILLFIGIILFYVLIGQVSSSDLIPKDALRIRIVANSNNEYDQYIKSEVKKEIEADMYKILEKASNVNDARKLINNNLSNIDDKVKTVLMKNDYKLGYQVNFGYNYFPEKTYKGITYKEGMYESLVVKLGKAEGDNWWCVLFPPLCLLEGVEGTDVEYKSYVKEIIDKYF